MAAQTRLAAAKAVEKARRGGDMRQARRRVEADIAADRSAVTPAPSACSAGGGGRSGVNVINAARFARPLVPPTAASSPGMESGGAGGSSTPGAASAGSAAAREAARASADRLAEATRVEAERLHQERLDAAAKIAAESAAARERVAAEARRRAAEADAASRERERAATEAWRRRDNDAGEAARQRRSLREQWPGRGGRGRGHATHGTARSARRFHSSSPSWQDAVPSLPRGAAGKPGRGGPGSPDRGRAGPRRRGRHSGDAPSAYCSLRERETSPGDGPSGKPARHRARSASSGERSSRPPRSGRRGGRPSRSGSSSSCSPSRNGDGGEPGWVRLVDSPAAEATLSQVFYTRHVRRLQGVYLPVGAHGLAWCAVVRLMRDGLVAAVDRVGPNTGTAARALGAAVGTAVSRSVLYARFRRALDVLLRTRVLSRVVVSAQRTCLAASLVGV